MGHAAARLGVVMPLPQLIVCELYEMAADLGWDTQIHILKQRQRLVAARLEEPQLVDDIVAHRIVEQAVPVDDADARDAGWRGRDINWNEERRGPLQRKPGHTLFHKVQRQQVGPAAWRRLDL